MIQNTHAVSQIIIERQCNVEKEQIHKRLEINGIQREKSLEGYQDLREQKKKKMAR